MSTPESTPPVEQPSPLKTAISVAIVNIGNVAVAFSLLANMTAATVETAVIGVVSVAFVLANELRHKTNTTTK